VYVGNIAWRVSWQDLKDHFREIGEPTYAEVFYDGDGRSKGCGVIEFQSIGEAEQAIKKMTDTKLKGRPIFVREDRESKSYSFQQRYKGGYEDEYYGGYGGYDDGYGRGGRGYYDRGYYDDYYYSYGKGDSWGKGGKGKGKGGKGKGEKGYGGKGYDSYGYGGKSSYGRDDYGAKGGYGKGKGKGKGDDAKGGSGRGGKSEGKGKSGGKGSSGGKEKTADSDLLGRQVFVGNLSWETTEENLKEHFASVGEVVKAQINSYRNGRSRGNGTVLFKTEKEAEKAIQQKNDTELQGREIFVKEDKYPE
jgi:RNA recognition motif-containing protein